MVKFKKMKKRQLASLLPHGGGGLPNALSNTQWVSTKSKTIQTN